MLHEICILYDIILYETTKTLNTAIAQMDRARHF